jgi:hypothetical protein
MDFLNVKHTFKPLKYNLKEAPSFFFFFLIELEEFFLIKSFNLKYVIRVCDFYMYF